MSSSDEVYAQLDTFLTEVYKIVDAATTLAVQDFENRHRDIEDYQLASTVRHETKCRLLELHGTEFECVVLDFDNNGVQIVYRGYAIRLRKKPGRGRLEPRQSEAMHLYFEQQPLDIALPDGTPIRSETNLVLFWEFDYVTHSLAGMDLWLPDDWMIKLPHPASEEGMPDVSAVAEEVDDLELEPRESESIEEEEDESKSDK